MDGDGGEINDEQRMYLERVDKSCARLERVISDLLHLSKLRSGEMAELLLSRHPKVNVNVMDRHGNTPVDCAKQRLLTAPKDKKDQFRRALLLLQERGGGRGSELSVPPVREPRQSQMPKTQAR